MAKVSHILKREIQAPLMKKLIDGFINHFGKRETLSVLKKIVEDDAETSAKDLIDEFGGNSMKELAEVIRKNWAEGDAMTMDFLEESDNRLSFNVTKCRYAEAYQKNNMTELGVCLSCDRDKPWTKSFNSDFELIRTQTIMEGAEFCDFRFVKNKSSQNSHAIMYRSAGVKEFEVLPE